MPKNTEKNIYGSFHRDLVSFISRNRLLIIAILMMIPLTVGYGDDEEAHLTVVNKTSHYLNIIIDGKPFLYVSPEMGVSHSSEPKSQFLVTAFYSPGQRIDGKISRTIEVEYRGQTSGCDYSSSGGCECTTEPAAGGSAIWEITADTMNVVIE